MSEPKWTPGPWAVSAPHPTKGLAFIVPETQGDEQDEIITSLANRANAALIVRAVNCHNELVDALQDALAGLRYVRQHYHDERTATGDLYGVGFDRVEEKAIAALARARGETP